MDRLTPLAEASRGARGRILRRLESLREDWTAEAASLRDLLRDGRSLWAAVCGEVIAGRTEQIHADRERLKQAIDESLQTIRDWLPLAGPLVGLEVTDLGTAAQEAERFWQRIFDRWQTPEDLEDLVANATAPTREQLDALTRKYGFPHAWHSADDTPV